MKITLPYPPSVNHYWRRVGDRTLLSKAGRRFKKDVLALLMAHGAKPLGDKRLAVTITLHPPDRRKRDIDNTIKATADSLQSAGLYDDDEQIDDLRVFRGEIRKGGVAVVEVEEIK